MTDKRGARGMLLGWIIIILSPLMLWMCWTSNDIEYLRFMAVTWAIMMTVNGIERVVPCKPTAKNRR